MFYGRDMACPWLLDERKPKTDKGISAYCNDGLKALIVDDRTETDLTLENRTVVNCLMKKCPQGQIPHFEGLDDKKKQNTFGAGIVC